MKPDIFGNFRFGNPNGFGESQKRVTRKVIENARSNKANLKAMDLICSARKEGMPYQAIADKLNRLEYITRFGSKFNEIQVQRLFLRCG